MKSLMKRPIFSPSGSKSTCSKMFSGCLMKDCLRSFSLVKSKGFVHLDALQL